MELKVMYSPLENGFYEAPFTVYEAALPEESTFKTLLGDVIKLPKYWTMNEEGIPITGNLLTEELEKLEEQELMINTNNPETPLSVNDKSNNKVVSLLMSRLNLTKQQASGIAGVMMSESGLNPASYNKAEKAGKLKSSKANGPGYGAGLLLWSSSRKKSALELIGKSGNIEDLSLEDLIEIVARELEGPYKNALDGIRASTTASLAAATMYCHNTGGFSRSSKPATLSEIDKMNRTYSQFTGKNPNDLIVNRGMRYAELIFRNS